MGISLIGTKVLREQVGSQISCDDYGIDTGTLTLEYPDADTAKAHRPVPGQTYQGGASPEFNGMFVHSTGMIRSVGNVAKIDVTLKALCAGWIKKPVLGSDNKDTSLTLVANVTRDTFLVAILNKVIDVLIPQPTVTYRYGVAGQRPRSPLGTFGEPDDAPSVSDVTYTTQNVSFGDFANPTVNQVTVTWEPDARGWMCIRYEATPLCGGRIYQIDEQWKRFYYLKSEPPTIGIALASA